MIVLTQGNVQRVDPLGVVIDAIFSAAWGIVRFVFCNCLATALLIGYLVAVFTAPRFSPAALILPVAGVGLGVLMWWGLGRLGAYRLRSGLSHAFPIIDVWGRLQGFNTTYKQVASPQLSATDYDRGRDVFKAWPSRAYAQNLARTDNKGDIIAPPIVSVYPVNRGVAFEIVPLASQSVDDFLDRPSALEQAFQHHPVEVTRSASGLHVVATMIDRDPLAQTIEVTPDELVLDPAKMIVRLGVDDDGAPVNVKFSGSSGLVIGGLPGGGKTAASIVLTLPLVMSPLARVHIVDAKGGVDWTWAEPKAASYIAGDDDLTPILELLRDLQSRMRERLASVPAGQPSNFWAREPNENEPFELLVLDECQSLFDISGERDKARKDDLLEITSIVADLVKKGRSAGFFTILLTQKPTSESLPTKIRDNCGLRICFRVATGEAEKAVLGVAPDDCTVRATDIPASLVGVGVVADDRGGRKRFRAFWLPEDLAAEAVAKG